MAGLETSATYISRSRSRCRAILFIHFASFFLLATPNARATLHTSCKLSQTPVQTDEQCRINCTFSENTDGEQFVVLFYKESSSVPHVRTVVDCYTYEGRRVCDVESGYEFRCKPGKTQSVVIPKADKEFEGKYVCQFLTSKDQEIESCSLALEDQVPTTHSQGGDITTYMDNGNEKRGELDDGAGRNTIIWRVGLVIVALVLFAGTAIYCIKERCTRKHKARFFRKICRDAEDPQGFKCRSPLNSASVEGPSTASPKPVKEEGGSDIPGLYS